MNVISWFDRDSDNRSAARSVVDQVAAQLMEEIITGDIASASKISEPELARRLDVSRSTIREAISRLEAAHLVTRKANVGARVVSLSSEELLEIYQIRESLEGLACRLAAKNMADAEISLLEELVARNIEQGGVSEITVLEQHRTGDLDFHYQVIRGSKNANLQRLLCHELYPKVSMYRYQFSMGTPRVKAGFNEHQFIVNAIRDRDGEMAEMLMRRHIRSSRLNIERQIAEPSAGESAAFESPTPARENQTI